MPDRMNDDEFNALLMRRLAGQEEDGFAVDGVEEEDVEDLLALQKALSSYREQSLEWAEKRSASMPSPLPTRSARGAWLQTPQWAFSAVALCACLIGGAMLTQHRNGLEQDAAAHLPAAPTDQTLAADNQLLSSVDDALRGSVAPSEQDLGLTVELPGERAQMRRNAQQHSN